MYEAKKKGMNVKDEICMMKQTRTYTYKKVNMKDGKLKLTTSDVSDGVVMVFCVCRCSSTNN